MLFNQTFTVQNNWLFAVPGIYMLGVNISHGENLISPFDFLGSLCPLGFVSFGDCLRIGIPWDSSPFFTTIWRIYFFGSPFSIRIGRKSKEAQLPWGLFHIPLPIGSMGLVYIPTFTIKTNHPCIGKDTKLVPWILLNNQDSMGFFSWLI